MNITYVTETYPPEINGVALTVARTVQYLRNKSHLVDLIRPRQSHEKALDNPGEWRTAGIPIPMYPDLRMGWASKAVMKKRFLVTHPDLVHIATQGPLGKAALKAANELDIPVTTDFRTNFHWYSRYYKLGWLEAGVTRYLKNFHNRASRTFVPEKNLKNELTELGFHRLSIIGRGVDAELFNPAKRSTKLRASWGAMSEQQNVLLYVGRLASEKNVQLALRAYADACCLRPRTRMVVVGDGPLRARLEAAYTDVNFVGIKSGEELAAHYASADLFVFPSMSETFGNVTLEAMASGLGVVAFNMAAASQFIQHGKNGWLAKVNDEAEFLKLACRATSLVSALSLPALRANARETALEVSWEAVMRQFESSLLNTAFNREPTYNQDAILA